MVASNKLNRVTFRHAREDLALHSALDPDLSLTPAQIDKICRVVLDAYLPAAEVEVCRHVWIYTPTPDALRGPRVFCAYCGRVDNSPPDIVSEAQLQELEDEEAVVDAYGVLWQKLGSGWYYPGLSTPCHQSMVKLPAQRLEMPKERP